jgi:dipeptidyl aminopeptidase/acylaminoacyl peptidase
LLIFGHGFHPDPKNYAISEFGKVSRPGDYYRNLPESYAQHGFVVISPDYRGHNVSQGLEYTKTSYLASSYYARDVLSLLSGVSDLKGIDRNRIYYLGHSMGVDVGLKVLLASDIFRAASLWSGVIASTPEQVLYYGKTSLVNDSAVNAAQFSRLLENIKGIYAQKAVGLNYQDIDPVSHIKYLDTPVMVHHGIGDTSTPYVWSESFVSRMLNQQKQVVYHLYNTDEHLFSGVNRARAVQRDVDFFNAY